MPCKRLFLLKHRREPTIEYAYEGALFAFAYTKPALEPLLASPPNNRPLRATHLYRYYIVKKELTLFFLFKEITITQ